MEHLGWGPVTQGPMGPLVIEEPEVGAQFPSGLDGVGVSFQVHLDTCNLEHSTPRQNIYLGDEPTPKKFGFPRGEP